MLSCMRYYWNSIVLATLYNKGNVLGSPPPSWSHSVVKFLHKKGPTNDPGNFRLISLTSSIAKTYHTLLAKRLTKFLTLNNYIDEKVQKAFLLGINGTIEHNVVLEEIISQAKTNKKTVHVTLSSYIPSKGLKFPQKVSFISTPCIIINFLVYLWTTSLLMGFTLKE